jgi:hypothetical protein
MKHADERFGVMRHDEVRERQGVVDKLCKKLCARTAFAIDRRNPHMKSDCGNASHCT